MEKACYKFLIIIIIIIILTWHHSTNIHFYCTSNQIKDAL